MSVRVLLSETYNPWFNLATENWIFRDLDPSCRTLFLWRNQDTVVIGRFQNPWAECNLEAMTRDGVYLARRQSGGGAVFHDLGNTNFTFLTGAENYDRGQNFRIITRALARFGIGAEVSGRNDIVVPTDDGQRKVSGSAFKENKDRCFHHGTLLISANLSRLANYLQPDKRKLESKGVASVRSRVANLAEISPALSHEKLRDAIIEEFFAEHGERGPIETLDHTRLESIPSLREYYDELRSDAWRLGETPKFTHHFSERFAWGGIDLYFQVKGMRIERTEVYSDSLHIELIEGLRNSLCELPYSGDAIEERIRSMTLQTPIPGVSTSVIDELCAKVRVATGTGE